MQFFCLHIKSSQEVLMLFFVVDWMCYNCYVMLINIMYNSLYNNIQQNPLIKIVSMLMMLEKNLQT